MGVNGEVLSSVCICTQQDRRPSSSHLLLLPHVQWVTGSMCNLCSLLLGGREAFCGPGEGLHAAAMVGEAELVAAGPVGEVRSKVHPCQERGLTDNGGAPALGHQGHGEGGPVGNGDAQLVTEPARA